MLVLLLEDIHHLGGDNNHSYSINGLLPVDLTGTNAGVGGSYYCYGVAVREGRDIIPQIGGQGGIDYGFYLGACGGIAGKGGNVSVKNAIIYAYNGDRFTTEDHSALNNNCDASNLITENNKIFVEAKNYAQSGVLRAIYCATTHWNSKPNNNYDYFSKLFGKDCSITGDFIKPTDHDENYKNVCVRQEKIITPLNYINPRTQNNQGIGSGFGYIELSNGTYTVDATLN